MYYISFYNYRNNRAKVSTSADKFVNYSTCILFLKSLNL